jgi:hypothetical protein
MLALATTVYFGAFFIQWGLGNLATYSMAWDAAIASAAAGTIVAVLLLVVCLALGPFGAIVGSVISLIDALTMALCQAFYDPTQPHSYSAQTAEKWLCGGLTGLVANALKAVMYSGALMVDLNREGGLQMYDFGVTLVHPDLGFVKGNAAVYGVSVTNTNKMAHMPQDILLVREYAGQWQDENNVLATTLVYTWTKDGNATIHDPLDLSKPALTWKRDTSLPIGDRLFSNAQDVVSMPYTLAKDGIDTDPPLFLTEGYAIPEQECWGFIGGYCWVHANKGTNSYDIGQHRKLTVMPNTLDGLTTLQRKGSGYALAWGQTGPVTFPTLVDADRDGLPAASDPNDSQADSDNDGHSDALEIQIGTNPLLADGDGDGVSDADELRHGTNPNLKGGDGDGLSDYDELKGWEFIYGYDKDGNPLKTWVWPDPLQADADADGLTDSKEKVYGYNPLAPSVANVMSLASGLSEGSGSSTFPSDGFVRPGQTVYYSATVENELANRQAQGLLQPQMTARLSSGAINPQEFVLRPGEQAQAQGQLSVASTASGAYTLTQVAGALITDWTEPAHGARLWLPFDDNEAFLADRSGSLPSHDGACPNGRLAGAGSIWGDSDLQLSVASDPPGLSLSGLGSGLFWVQDPGASLNAAAANPGLPDLLVPRHTPLRNGQDVAYTVQLHRAGSQTAPQVRLELAGYGALQVEPTVLVGDIGPGAEVEAAFHGHVAYSPGALPVAAVKVLVHSGPPVAGAQALEWSWVSRR